jgi:hypothetical protein
LKNNNKGGQQAVKIFTVTTFHVAYLVLVCGAKATAEKIHSQNAKKKTKWGKEGKQNLKIWKLLHRISPPNKFKRNFANKNLPEYENEQN